MLFFLATRERIFVHSVFARVSRPGCLSLPICKSGRGWLKRRGWLYYIYIPIFLEGCGLRQILSKDSGLRWLARGAAYTIEYGIYGALNLCTRCTIFSNESELCTTAFQSMGKNFEIYFNKVNAIFPSKQFREISLRKNFTRFPQCEFDIKVVKIMEVRCLQETSVNK